MLPALALSILGHAGIGLFWSAPVVSPTPLVARGVSVMPSSLKIRWLRGQADTVATTPLPNTTPTEVSTDTPHEPETTEGLRLGRFVPSDKLDSPLVPMSAPDTSQLEGVYFSGQPIRLRILVTASGQVVEVLILKASPEDAEAATQLKRMFLDTAYIPGNLDGKPVAAQLDMELRLD